MREAQNRALRVINLDDKETVHNAFGTEATREVPDPSHPSLLRTRAMKIRYFPNTDTLYIELVDRVSSSPEAVSDNLIVDFDALGKPVGVTPVGQHA